MKAYELMEVSLATLERLLSVGVSLKDIKYLPMYRKFLEMKEQGYKVAYIEEKLSEEYRVTSRRIRYIARKFGGVL